MDGGEFIIDLAEPREATGAATLDDMGAPRTRSAAAGGIGAARRYALSMCRNIRSLHNFEPPASHEEMHDAALQYVRKISGSTKPSQANAEVFERAVAEVALATERLLGGLLSPAAPKDREVEAAKRRARSAQRFAA